MTTPRRNVSLTKKEVARRDLTYEPIDRSLFWELYAVNELPQPHPPEALGFVNVNPDPIMLVT